MRNLTRQLHFAVFGITTTLKTGDIVEMDRESNSLAVSHPAGGLGLRPDQAFPAKPRVGAM